MQNTIKISILFSRSQNRNQAKDDENEERLIK